MYKQEKQVTARVADQEVVKKLVDKVRKQLPRVGTRKIHYLIQEDLAKAGLRYGRDKMFALLRHYGLLVKPRRRCVQTTMSKHWLRKWPNIIKGNPAGQPDDHWVSDITYIKTEEGHCYLNMITDAYSRKIVGYAVDDTMETESMIRALHMANKQRLNPLKTTIHHSDRGLQYCSKEYALQTAGNNIKLSMTENGDPYENALAERMNRTIKEEFGMDRTLKNKQQLEQLVHESVYLYNNKRPHLALQMKTPQEVYQQKIPVT